jgi:bifunctional non-homologous end joining protein LigD
MPLDEYRRKRDFARTPEPAGEPGGGRPEGEPQGQPGGAAPERRRFVVGRHRATRLHYDLRLEVGGVLVSWAVPKGPTLDPGSRRTAVKVEDHPIEYLDFEEVIPSGSYGAGDAIVWDRGRYEPEQTDDPAAALGAGELKFRLQGEKLRGRFTLVRTRGDGEQWLLIKKRDADAVPGWDPEEYPRSVVSGLTNEEVRARSGVPGITGRGGPVAARPGVPAAAAGGPAMPGSDPPGAITSAMPGFIRPMLATLADAPFSDPDWLFEVKWDGYRAQAHVRAGRVRLFTRSGLELGSETTRLFEPPSWIAAGEAVLDGELVAIGPSGAPDFGLLQEALGRGGGSTSGSRDAVPLPRSPGGGSGSPAPVGSPLSYIAFDLLYLDGRLLVDVPLEERLRLLHTTLQEHPRVRHGGVVEADGEAFFAAAAGRGLEGMVAKHRRSRYQPGRRSRLWLKIKARPEQEFVVVGYAPGEGSHADLGSLLLAVRDGGDLRYAGRVGSGFSADTRRRLAARLEPIRRDTSPLASPPPLPPSGPPVWWVSPELVVRVRFAGWTRDGLVRQASYAGTDEWRDAAGVGREQAVQARSRPQTGSALQPGQSPWAGRAAGGSRGAIAPASDILASLDALRALDDGGAWHISGRTLRLTNLDRVLFPADGITKRDLICYYVEIAPVLLSHLADRALNLIRHPGGIDQPGFWQRELPATAPAWLTRWREPDPAGRPAHTHLVADDIATLAWLGNAAAIELHPWTSPTSAPDRPAYALIDIDPGEATTFAEVATIARLFRVALDHLGVRGFPKLTGKRGIQVFVPVEPRYGFDEIRDWVFGLSRAVAAAVPDLVSWEWSVDRRAGRARLDFTQNARNKTLVGPYSVRAVPGAPVSAPIAWEELDDPELAPDRWSIRTMVDRVRARGDLFAGALDADQALPPLG